ncbi:MAG: site-specific integrase, partial [Cyclobacteriaceae bacterium]|nr:site-specific integrase [Cyclobacteriaceae bacterium]
MNWEQAINQYINYLKIERSLSENSVLAYQQDVIKLRQFLEMSNPDRSPVQVDEKDLHNFIEYVASIGLSSYSQARILSGLKSFFKYLLYEDMIKTAPTELIDGPKLGRKLPDTLSYDEIVKILDVIDLSTPEGARNRAIIETLYSCGLRVSELVDLRINNLYIDSGFIRVVGKGDKERLVPIGRDAGKFIEIYQNEIRVHLNIKKGNENY